MNIDALGPSWCQALIDNNLLSNPADLYKLTISQLTSMDRMGTRLATRVLQNVEDSKTRSLPQVFYALGIYRLGRKVSKLLSDRYGSIAAASQVSLAELSIIPGIGPKIAEEVVKGLRSPNIQRTLQLLEAAGVKLEQSTENLNNKEVNNLMTNKFEGLNFVVTGALQLGTRNDAKSMIMSQGGNVSDTVNARTNYLVVGEKPGSKLAKAKSLNVPVLSEAEFREMMA